jgi:hypothetical protein
MHRLFAFGHTPGTGGARSLLFSTWCKRSTERGQAYRKSRQAPSTTQHLEWRFAMIYDCCDHDMIRAFIFLFVASRGWSLFTFQKSSDKHSQARQ